jgi:hypothetical protein
MWYGLDEPSEDGKLRCLYMQGRQRYVLMVNNTLEKTSPVGWRGQTGMSRLCLLPPARLAIRIPVFLGDKKSVP